MGDSYQAKDGGVEYTVAGMDNDGVILYAPGGEMKEVGWDDIGATFDRNSPDHIGNPDPAGYTSETYQIDSEKYGTYRIIARTHNNGAISGLATGNGPTLRFQYNAAAMKKNYGNNTETALRDHFNFGGHED